MGCFISIPMCACYHFGESYLIMLLAKGGLRHPESLEGHDFSPVRASSLGGQGAQRLLTQLGPRCTVLLLRELDKCSMLQTYNPPAESPSKYLNSFFVYSLRD